MTVPLCVTSAGEAKQVFLFLSGGTDTTASTCKRAGMRNDRATGCSCHLHELHVAPARFRGHVSCLLSTLCLLVTFLPLAWRLSCQCYILFLPLSSFPWPRYAASRETGREWRSNDNSVNNFFLTFQQNISPVPSVCNINKYKINKYI